jgi:PAT family beta-lactamase induction signal transducer AmpG
MRARSAIRYSMMGIISGAPAALLTSSIQAWLADRHSSLWLIGMLGFLSFPYAAKPLLSIVLNYIRLRIKMGYQELLLCMGCMLAGSLFALGQCDPVLAPVLFSIQLFGGCVLSAMADICIDGLRVDIQDGKQQALAGAFYVGAYRVAVIAAAGLGLLWASYYGWGSLYGFGAGVVLLVSGIVYLTDEKNRADQVVVQSLTSKALLAWLTTPRVGYAVLGVLLLKSHDQFVESLMQVYLLNHLALSLETVAVLYKTVGVAASIIGGLIAGWAMTVVRDDKLVLWSIAAKLVCMVGFVASLVTHGESQRTVVALALCSECFASGFTATMVVVIMTRLCDRTFGATQFAFLSSMVFALRALMAPFAAAVLAQWGWYGFFVVASFLLILPSVVTLRDRMRRDGGSAEVMA